MRRQPGGERLRIGGHSSSGQSTTPRGWRKRVSIRDKNNNPITSLVAENGEVADYDVTANPSALLSGGGADVVEYLGTQLDSWVQGVQRSFFMPMMVEGPGEVKLPTEVLLRSAQPNPFAGTTTMSHGLPEASPVKLAVYDVSGRLVRVLATRMQPAGEHPVLWDGRDEAGSRVATGLYLYRRETKAKTITRRLIVTEQGKPVRLRAVRSGHSARGGPPPRCAGGSRCRAGAGD